MRRILLAVLFVLSFNTVFSIDIENFSLQNNSYLNILSNNISLSITNNESQVNLTYYLYNSSNFIEKSSQIILSSSISIQLESLAEEMYSIFFSVIDGTTPLQNRTIVNISHLSPLSYNISGVGHDYRDFDCHENYCYFPSYFDNTVYVYNENFTYNGTSYDLTGSADNIEGIYFKNDSWYLLANNSQVLRYDVNFNYLESYSLLSEMSIAQQFYFYNDSWYVLSLFDDTIYVYAENFTYTGTSYDVSSPDAVPIDFFNQGGSWYAYGNQYDFIYDFGNNWTYTGVNFSIYDTVQNVNSLLVSENIMYVLEPGGGFKVSFVEEFYLNLNKTEVTNLTFFTVDTIDPNFILKNNYSDGMEITSYEFVLLDFTETNDSNLNYTNYSYNGQEIDEFLITAFRDRPTLGIKNYTGVSYNISNSTPFITDILFKDNMFYLLDFTTNMIDVYDSNFIYLNMSYNTTAQDLAPFSIDFKDGFFYVVGSSTDTIYQYYENFTYTGNSFDVSSQATNPKGLTFHNDSWYLSDFTSNNVFQYYENFTYTGNSFDISGENTAVSDIYRLGDFYYSVDYGTNEIYQYNDSWNYTGLSFDTLPQDTFPTCLEFSNGEFYVGGAGTDFVYLYNHLVNETRFRFDFNGNQTINAIVFDKANNFVSRNYTVFVNPFQYFKFNNTFGQQLFNFTFGGTFFEEQAALKIYDIGLGNQTLLFEKLGYNSTNVTLEYNTTSEYDVTIIIPLASIFLNIFDRATDALLTGLSFVTMIGPTGFFGNTTTGQINISDVLFIADDYSITVEHQGYATETIYFTFTNQQEINLEISLINESNPNLGTITYVLKNQDKDSLVGAICQALEWNPDQDAFVKVSEDRTNDQGRCTMNIELETKTYQFFFTFEDLSKITQSERVRLDGEVRTIVLEDQALDVINFNEEFIVSINETEINSYTSRLNFFSRNTLGETHTACINRYKIIMGVRTLIDTICSSGTTVDFSSTYATNNTYILEVEGVILNGESTIPIDSFLHKAITSMEKLLDNYDLNRFIAFILIVFGLSVGGLGLFKDNEAILNLGTLIVIVSTWFIFYVFPSLYSGVFAASMTVVGCYMLYAGFVSK